MAPWRCSSIQFLGEVGSSEERHKNDGMVPGTTVGVCLY